MDIKKLVRKNILGLNAYEAREVHCKVKLDANECPYGFRLHDLKVPTNRYPDPEARALRAAIARKLRRVGAPNILMGNGSDELIYYLITTFGGPVVYPKPTFVMYDIIARALGERAVGVALDDSFDLDLNAMLRAIKQHRPKLVFLSSPNNPTGNCFGTDRIMRVMEAASKSGIVVVDEAYQPYSSEEGMIGLMEDYKNLAILRTLSKVGLAALRVGYLIADAEIIAEVNKVRLPYNLNGLSQKAAHDALEDRKGMAMYISAVIAERGRLYSAMCKIKGISPYPTEANFILFKTERPNDLHAALLKRGVLIKDLSPATEGAMRVTVGTRKENDAFLSALKDSLSAMQRASAMPIIKEAKPVGRKKRRGKPGRPAQRRRQTV